MCYSAEASFGLSAALLPAGGYCIQRALRANRLLLPIAVVPILFGVQQFAEGWVWVGLNEGNADLTRSGTLFFLFFALVFWPLWVPFCAFLTRTTPAGRLIFAGAGMLGGAAGLWVLLPLAGVDFALAEVAHHSVHYQVARSPVFDHFPKVLWEGTYVVIVSSPLLTSTDSRMIYLGLALVLGSAVTYLLFYTTFTSVWCFFAAVLSLYLCFYFRGVAPGE